MWPDETPGVRTSRHESALQALGRASSSNLHWPERARSSSTAATHDSSLLDKLLLLPQRTHPPTLPQITLPPWLEHFTRARAAPAR